MKLNIIFLTKKWEAKMASKQKESYVRKVLILVSIVCLAAMVLPNSSNATLINIDEIIYETTVPDTNPDVLVGTVYMAIAGDELTITLTNTSTGVASTEASQNLLTGLGFNLPYGVFIDSGSVFMATGSTAINFDPTLPDLYGDVSGEWGYDDSLDGGLDAGPFQNVSAGGEAYSTVNTTVSAMQSSAMDGTFGTYYYPHPDNNLDGPEFGLLSGNVDYTVAGGLPAIQDSVIISLTLGGPVPDGLINFIDQGDVVLSFGSPDTSTIPEPSTMLLFGSGLIGLSVLGRKKIFKRG